MRTSDAFGSAAAMASDSAGGVSTSSSPTITSVGHGASVGSSGVESGRSIIRTIGVADAASATGA